MDGYIDHPAPDVSPPRRDERPEISAPESVQKAKFRITGVQKNAERLGDSSFWESSLRGRGIRVASARVSNALRTADGVDADVELELLNAPIAATQGLGAIGILITLGVTAAGVWLFGGAIKRATDNAMNMLMLGSAGLGIWWVARNILKLDAGPSVLAAAGSFLAYKYIARRAE